ncbi:MAG: hypothetical protein H8D87_18165 [Deltaproteobacteria bacterium]|uniref:hypothetical protein n=1 Tax=Desulfobacula sp. TaxID=2593537 RepID=UPI00198F2B92|nr:hypothetical protein [Candidatus Desulfobacula maris]MBL6993089.1 hypothetical protein [Desulfobacula sp.]
MTETATNSASDTIVSFYDWKSKQKESDTTSVPVVAEEEVATSLELEQLIPHIATYIERMNFADYKKNEATTIKLNLLETKRLRHPLDVIIEEDDEGFIARVVDFSLFGCGDDRIEAVDALKFEIESLYFDLIEDDNFTEEWLNIKNFLKELIIDS